MKSKQPTKQTDLDLEDEDSDIEKTNPGGGSAKRNKIIIIVASSILITVVIYMMFFKTEQKKQEHLEPVAPPKAVVATADGGKSPFEIEQNTDKTKEEANLLEKPMAPEIPTLPTLPEDAVPKDLDNLVPPTQQAQQVQQPQLPLLPSQQNLQQLNSQQPPVATPGQAVGAAGQAAIDAANQKKDIDPRYSPILVFSSGASDSTVPGIGYDKSIINSKEDPFSKMDKAQSAVTTTYITDRTQTIAQGKMLTAVLETAINTEIPGLVRAVVSRDVYAESGTNVLIPRGSRLFGSYSSSISRGQGRVQISWTRLLRPDGVNMTISFNASDQFGRSGISGTVDNRYGSLVATSMLTSILALGGVIAAQGLIGNNATSTTTTNPQQGTATTTGSASNQALYNFSQSVMNTVGQVVSNSIDITPIIRIPQGTRITVIVNANIMIPPMRNTQR
jgi:type IV secretion system protein VirB10